MTLTDTGGTTLRFRITWSKKPNGRPARPRSGLRAAVPRGYHPVQIEILPAEGALQRGEADYHFTAEDGAAVRATVRP